MSKTQDTKSPRVFISYSWDSDEHRDWVESLATQLRNAGIDARLDRWRDKNQSIDDFMMVELERADYVLAICTPRFKQKVMDNAEGSKLSASGTEMGTAAAFRRVSGKVTVPILARGEFSEAAPANLLGSEYYDFTHGDRRKAFDNLKRHLLGQTKTAPPLGQISVPEEQRTLPDIFASAPNTRGGDNSFKGDGRSTATSASENRGGGAARGSRNNLAWAGLPLLFVAAGLLAANQWAFWPFEDNNGPADIVADQPSKTFYLVLESLKLEECELAMAGNQEEPCLFLNDEPIFGCKMQSFTCGSGSPTIDLQSGSNRVEPRRLTPGANFLSMYEEDKPGHCENLVATPGSNYDCSLKGKTALELKEQPLNAVFKDGRVKYRLTGKVVRR